MLKRKKIKPITLKDVTIIDDGKLKKAITAASLGNAMEWFDFGVYGFVAYALGKVFFPDANPSVQMIAALGTFSVPFLIRPLGGLFFGMLGDKYGRQKILAITIVIMSISTFCIGLIPSYATIGIWAPILLLLCKMAQGFSVGGEYTGASIFVAEYSPDRKRGFMGSWLDFGSIAGFVMGAGVVVLISSVVGEQNFLDWGWRIPFFLALPLGIIGLYLRHALEETPAFQQHVDTMEQGDREGLQDGPKVSFKEIATKHWRSLLTCIGLVISTNVTYYMLLTYMPSYLSHNLHYSEDHGVLIIIAIMVGMLFVQPVIGMLSDRFGRRPFILIGSVALFALSIPAFIMINSNVTGLIFAGLLLLAVGNGAVTVAEHQNVPSGIAAVVVATVPLFTLCFSRLFGIRTRKLEWLGIAIGLVGIILLNSGGNLSGNPWAAVLIMIGSMSWAFGSVYGSRIELPSGMMAGAIEMLAAGIVLLLASALTGEKLTAMPDLSGFLAVGYLALFGSIIAINAYMYLIRNVSPAVATSYAYVNPVVAVLLGTGFAGEVLSTIEWLALGVIVFAVVLVTLGKYLLPAKPIITTCEVEKP